MKTALITGITGLYGFCLAEFLLNKGYEVHGIKRHTYLLNNDWINASYQSLCVAHSCFHLHYADLTDAVTLIRLVREIQPDEIYNLEAISQVNAPFETPEHIHEMNGLITLRLLDAVHCTGLIQKTHVFQCSKGLTSSSSRQSNQPDHTFLSASANTSSAPIKLSSNEILTKYRAAYGLHASNGSLFNYEFTHQGETLVMRKITQSAVRIALGLQGVLYLDSLSTRRDWGHAQDYAEAMWRVLQQETPEDVILATGVTTTVREFVRLVFSELEIDVVFQGEGKREVGYVAASHNPEFTLMPGQSVVALDPIYYQSETVEPSLAEVSKVRRQLGWKPRHDLRTLVRTMVQQDLEFFRRETHSIKAGQQVLLHTN
jgi:GDPmannose 4,6-dehydratase